MENNEHQSDNNLTPPPENDELETYEARRFVRSRTDRIFLGVCGGIAQYMDIDPIIVRILFVFTILIGGWGAVIYAVAAMLIPVETVPDDLSDEELYTIKHSNTKTLIGSSLILIGFFFLIDFYGFLNYFSFLGIPPELFWPVSFIFIGVYFFRKHRKSKPGVIIQKKFYRLESAGRFMGVCSGLAKYLNTDSNLIRMGWLVFTFISLGLGIIIYFLIVIMVPYHNEG